MYKLKVRVNKQIESESESNNLVSEENASIYTERKFVYKYTDVLERFAVLWDLNPNVFSLGISPLVNIVLIIS